MTEFTITGYERIPLTDESRKLLAPNRTSQIRVDVRRNLADLPRRQATACARRVRRPPQNLLRDLIRLQPCHTVAAGC